MSLIRRLIFGRDPRRTSIRVLVLAAVSFVTFKWVLIPIRTEGPSMEPTYGSGELRLVYMLAYRASAPARGDVVAIRMAGPHVLYVKRVIGLPGERVAVAQGLVQVNGVTLDEPYVRNRRPWDVPEVMLGQREYFVIGDNRGMAAGAHDFGRVETDRILGRVVF